MKQLIVLLFGLVLGFCISQLLHMASWSPRYRDSSIVMTLRRNLRARYEDEDDSTGDGGVGFGYEAVSNSNSEVVRTHEHKTENTSIAARLYNETRVLCWILTGPANHKKKAIHIKKTWGARCNKLLFMSSEEDAELGTIKLPVGEGRKNLWNKTRHAFKYIWDHHRDDADWFLKADDDTYVIAENLRAFLHPFSTKAPVYFGCKFKPHVRQGYMSGGAGYILSWEALRRFGEVAYHNGTICRNNSRGSEDTEMGYCLQNVGVVAGDSRDKSKRGRFFPNNPQSHIIPRDKSHWYWRYTYYPAQDGLNCCSDYAVSFHYIHPESFYLMDYLIYHLRPFGLIYNEVTLPAKYDDMEELLNIWRNETSQNKL